MKNKIIVFVAVFLTSVSLFLLLLGPNNKVEEADNKAKENILPSQEIKIKDTSKTENQLAPEIVKTVSIKPNTEKELTVQWIESAEIKTDNYGYENYKKPVASLADANSTKYSPKTVNRFNLQGLYYIQSEQWVPVVKFLERWSKTSVELDISIPPDSAKHNIISNRLIAYVADVDVIMDGKAVEVVDLITKEKKRFPVSDASKYRINWWSANQAWTKLEVTEETTPTSDNLASTNTLYHKTWVYDLNDPSKPWTLIFDQWNNAIERWPFAWSSYDNSIYFNSCDVVAFHCDFWITKVSENWGPMEEVKWLWNLSYASQPSMSPNWKFFAFPAWNGNKNTNLYAEGEDSSNAFLNRNVLKLYDAETKTVKRLLDFGSTKMVDNIFWAPDWTKILFQLSAMTNDNLTTNSKWIWYYNLLTWDLAQIMSNTLISPGYIFGWFKASDDWDGIYIKVLKMFPKSDFKTLDWNFPWKNTEYFYLRLKDMSVVSLWGSIRSLIGDSFY